MEGVVSASEQLEATRSVAGHVSACDQVGGAVKSKNDADLIGGDEVQAQPLNSCVSPSFQ